MKHAGYVDEPMERYCELVDISVLGLRLDRELPCTPGVKVFFRLVIPSYGATPKPTEMELAAEVVRVEGGYTGLRFVRLRDAPDPRGARARPRSPAAAAAGGAPGGARSPPELAAAVTAALLSAVPWR